LRVSGNEDNSSVFLIEMIQFCTRITDE
jgi:hypothetical protein